MRVDELAQQLLGVHAGKLRGVEQIGVLGVAVQQLLLRLARCCPPALYQADCKAPPKTDDHTHAIKD